MLRRRASFLECAWGSITAEHAIGDVLQMIKGGTYNALISELRVYLAVGAKDKYDIGKKRLPSVTFCGTFLEKRRTDCIKQYNELVVFDVDHLEGAALLDAKRKLQCEPSVLALWTSPSSAGLKGLVPLRYDLSDNSIAIPLRHKAAFRKLSARFREDYNVLLDPSGSDVTRLCFLSSDPELIQKSDVEPMPIVDVDVLQAPLPERAMQRTSQPAAHHAPAVERSRLNCSDGKNSASNRNLMRSITKYLAKRNLSITTTFDMWVSVAFAIADSFTYDIGEAYFLRLCRLDGSRHDEEGSKRLLLSCYMDSRGEVSMGTIVYLAQKQGYKMRNGVEGSTEEGMRQADPTY
ncbi:MAG: hypothetical protein KA248_10700 [Kiritimatiellae bacterium]|nr:hypothetical protein [Kiritimatiellia bacterium]